MPVQPPQQPPGTGSAGAKHTKPFDKEGSFFHVRRGEGQFVLGLSSDKVRRGPPTPTRISEGGGL